MSPTLPPLPPGAIPIDEGPPAGTPPLPVGAVPFNLPVGAGPPKTQAQVEQGMREAYGKALQYAPGVLGAALALTQPELLPAVAAAGIGGAGGSLIKQGGQTALGLPEAPQGVGQAALTLGKDVATQAAAEAGGRALAAPFEWLASKVSPRALYQGALKPSPTMAPEEAQKLVETGLQEGIPVSASGYQKARQTIKNINQQIDDIIQAKSDELGAVINPESVAQRVEEIRPRFAQQVNPEADLAALTKAQNEFLRQHTELAPYTKIVPGVEEPGFISMGEGQTAIPQNLTAAEAQAIKKGTYRQLERAQGPWGQLSAADVEAQKAMVRGLKEDLAMHFPQLQTLNPREGALIDLRDELGRHVIRQANRTGMTPTQIAEIVAAGTGHPDLAAAGILKSAIDDPAIRSKLAIVLNRAMQSPVGKVGTALLRPRAAIPSAIQIGASPNLGTLATPQQQARGGTILDRWPSRDQVLGSLVR